MAVAKKRRLTKVTMPTCLPKAALLTRLVEAPHQGDLAKMPSPSPRLAMAKSSNLQLMSQKTSLSTVN
ncbi:hypothetical protein TIFTF001_048902 [Ficus carica]|uniref:Uncharacterized protein n=1 Tax=Ficus carica TaxID=3494 RepID=A0AA88CKY6_FICCA|nr:hypothetical protein TIFTF001_048902 [Ficus carica]